MTLTPAQQTYSLFAGIGVVLLVASLIGYALKASVAKGQPHATIDNLNARIKAWWVMVLVIGFSFLFGRPGVVLLFLLISFFALREFLSLMYSRAADYYALAAAFYVVLPVQYLLVYVGWYGLYSIFIPVYAFLLLPILEVTAGDTKRFLERSSKVQWGLMICVFCIAHVPALLTLEIPGYEDRNLLLIAFLVIVVQSSDVLQYVWGKLFGKTKLAPEVSPSKTVEGLVGGIWSATVLGAFLWWITPFAFWQAALMSLMTAAVDAIAVAVVDEAATTSSGLAQGRTRREAPNLEQRSAMAKIPWRSSVRPKGATGVHESHLPGQLPRLRVIQGTEASRVPCLAGRWANKAMPSRVANLPRCLDRTSITGSGIKALAANSALLSLEPASPRGNMTPTGRTSGATSTCADARFRHRVGRIRVRRQSPRPGALPSTTSSTLSKSRPLPRLRLRR